MQGNEGFNIFYGKVWESWVFMGKYGKVRNFKEIRVLRESTEIIWITKSLLVLWESMGK